MDKRKISRRGFIKAGVAGAALVPVALSVQRSAAGEFQALTADDPMAVALNYVADAANVDTKKFPQYQAGQTCANCLQVKKLDADGALGCALFPGKLVAADGWCQVWAKG